MAAPISELIVELILWLRLHGNCKKTTLETLSANEL